MKRYSHPTYSNDLLPRAMVVEDSPEPYLDQLIHASDPDPDGFADTFTISQAVEVDCAVA
jgi:hypothetical protein